MSEAEEALEDHETPVLKRRLIASTGFLLVLMYFSMGHMMWGWPLPAWFNDNHIAMGLVQLLLAGIVMVINQKFFISGFKSLCTVLRTWTPLSHLVPWHLLYGVFMHSSP